jgi:signal transduction histidine kinase
MLSSKEKDYEKVEKYATSINIAANHTFHLLSNLLDWSRSQRNKILFQPEVLNMKEISRQIIVLYSYMIDEKQIFVETRIDSAVTLYADSNMVQTIMRNLVSNAIKFSGEEDTIHISASQKEREVEICVADTGKGILGEDLEKIFHPGLSVSTNGSHDEKGSGLGLIICKDFVERHGGKIWIESKENIGTKVYFTIPENLKTAK